MKFVNFENSRNSNLIMAYRPLHRDNWGLILKQVILMGIFISQKIEGCIMYTSHVLIINRCYFSVNCHQFVEDISYPGHTVLI